MARLPSGLSPSVSPLCTACPIVSFAPPGSSLAASQLTRRSHCASIPSPVSVLPSLTVSFPTCALGCWIDPTSSPALDSHSRNSDGHRHTPDFLVFDSAPVRSPASLTHSSLPLVLVCSPILLFLAYDTLRRGRSKTCRCRYRPLPFGTSHSLTTSLDHSYTCSAHAGAMGETGSKVRPWLDLMLV